MNRRSTLLNYFNDEEAGLCSEDDSDLQTECDSTEYEDEIECLDDAELEDLLSFETFDRMVRNESVTFENFSRIVRAESINLITEMNSQTEIEAIELEPLRGRGRGRGRARGRARGRGGERRGSGRAVAVTSEDGQPKRGRGRPRSVTVVPACTALPITENNAQHRILKSMKFIQHSL